MTTSPAGLRLALISAFPPGSQSLNEYGLHLATGLAARDDVAEVIVLADRLDSDQPELDLGPKITIRRVWSFNSTATLFKLVSALRAAKVDGALFNLQTATFGDREVPAALGLFAPLAARLSGVPSGVIAHNLVGGIDLDETQLKGQPLRQAIVRLGGALVTRALVSANYMTVTLESYRRMLAASHPDADVTLVPHGTFETTAVDFIPSSERALRIVTMGKFGTYKRLETLLAAFDKLRLKPGFEQLELVIGGSDHPNAQGYLASLAHECRDDPGLNFRGYIAEEDVASFFSEARVSVFDYSATTGSSGVLHQTASNGTAPVFPHIGDFVDVARDEGLDGRHFEPENADSMADAILDLLEDTETCDRIAKANIAASQEMPFSKVVAYHVERFGGFGSPASEVLEKASSLRSA